MSQPLAVQITYRPGPKARIRIESEIAKRPGVPISRILDDIISSKLKTKKASRV